MIVKEYHKKGDRTQRFRILLDEHPEDPWRAFDHYTEVIHCHSRYEFDGESQGDQEFVQAEAIAVRKAGGAVLPLFLYEHGNSVLATEPFSCPWDSGQIGYAVIRKEVIDKDFEGKVELAEACIRAEIQTLSQYWNGEVYGWAYVELEECSCCGVESEDVGDSCWGFYGADFENMLSDAGFNPDEWEEA